MTIVHLDSLGGVNYHRIIVPMMRLQNQGLNVVWIQSLTELKNFNLDLVDNLVVSRKVSVTNHKEFSRMLKRHNVKLILDNDDYWVLNPENPSKALYDAYYGPDIKKTIKIADVIWTPSKYLGKVMSSENSKAVVEFVNNAIDSTEYQWANQRKNPSSKLRFGYMGASSHIYDVMQIKYDYSKIYTVGVENMGYDHIFNYDKILEGKDVWTYGQLYRDIDVSFVPLVANKFNWCKSDLKVTEAAWTKTAVIASNTRPYNGVIRNGETGFLCRTPEEWADAIERMDKKLAKKLGGNLYDDLKFHDDYNLDKVNLKRLNHLT